MENFATWAACVDVDLLYRSLLGSSLFCASVTFTMLLFTSLIADDGISFNIGPLGSGKFTGDRCKVVMQSHDTTNVSHFSLNSSDCMRFHMSFEIDCGI